MCPGATTSGFANPSYHDGPRELYGATRSSSRDTVSKCVDGADGERRWRIRRRDDPRISDLTRFRIHAEVACSHDHCQPFARSVFDSLHERVGRRVLVNWMAERQVEYVDAEQLAIRNRELDRADHVVRGSSSAAVENLQSDESRMRRYADELAADESRNVSAVPVVVMGVTARMSPFVKS